MRLYRRYVASQMKKQIEKVGAERVFLVVIDGGVTTAIEWVNW